MSTGEVEEILSRRRHDEMAKRRTWFAAVVVVLAVLVLLMVPAMSNPLRALRMQQYGIEAQAKVTSSDSRPVTCDGSRCTETAPVVFNTAGGNVPDAVLTADVSALSRGGVNYALTSVEHEVASVGATSEQGDTFPVWFVPASHEFPQDLTSQRPPNPFVSAVTTWWWLLIPMLLVLFYPRLDAHVRRRGTGA